MSAPGFEYFVRLSDGTEVRYSEIAAATEMQLIDWADDITQSLRKIDRQLAEKDGASEWRTRAATARFAYRRALREITALLAERPAADVVAAFVARAESFCIEPPRKRKPTTAENTPRLIDLT